MIRFSFRYSEIVICVFVVNSPVNVMQLHSMLHSIVLKRKDERAAKHRRTPHPSSFSFLSVSTTARPPKEEEISEHLEVSLQLTNAPTTIVPPPNTVLPTETRRRELVQPAKPDVRCKQHVSKEDTRERRRGGR